GRHRTDHRRRAGARDGRQDGRGYGSEPVYFVAVFVTFRLSTPLTPTPLPSRGEGLFAEAHAPDLPSPLRGRRWAGKAGSDEGCTAPPRTAGIAKASYFPLTARRITS